MLRRLRHLFVACKDDEAELAQGSVESRRTFATDIESPANKASNSQNLVATGNAPCAVETATGAANSLKEAARPDDWSTLEVDMRFVESNACHCGGTFEQKEPCPDQKPCLLYTSPSPRDQRGSRMPSSA